MPHGELHSHPKLANNPRFQAFLPGCIGAVDGSHYECRVPAEQRDVYRNRHGETSFNVCGIVDFSGRWIYMLAGWEGSAHDSRVYHDAWNKDLVIPREAYVLGDGGYGNSHRVITPYRGIRYHLQETARNHLRPVSPKELFNLRHSQLRITVEKAFGMHKAMFKILTMQPQQSIDTHIKLIYAIAVVMNFRLDHGDPEDSSVAPDISDDIEGSGNENRVGNNPESLDDSEVDGSEDGRMGKL